MKNRVKISIDGKSFTLVGEETEEQSIELEEIIEDESVLEETQVANEENPTEIGGVVDD